MATPYTGVSWDIVFRNLVLDRTLVVPALDDVSVIYSSTINGTPYLSGSLSYGAHNRPRDWVARITLPTTPGKFVVIVNASATIDGQSLTGRDQQSLQVI